MFYEEMSLWKKRVGHITPRDEWQGTFLTIAYHNSSFVNLIADFEEDE